MAAAARIAARARPLSRPNPAVGAVFVRDGRMVARGWTQPGGRPHAEAQALAMAGKAARGATAYVTLEPCAHASDRGPACSHSLAAAGIAACCYAVPDPDPRTAGKGARWLESRGVTVRHLPCGDATESLAGYLMQRRAGRPFVTLKLALSLDGAIALPDGESHWITGPVARAHVHASRARQDAILVGAGTWRADAPRLDVRLPGLEALSPRRLVLTGGAAPDGVEAIASPTAITRLGDVQYLYIEGGAQTAAAFIKDDLVDQLEIYRAPIIIGGGRPGVADIGLDTLAQAHGRWRLVEQRQLGNDSFTAYRRMREGD